MSSLNVLRQEHTKGGNCQVPWSQLWIECVLHHPPILGTPHGRYQPTKAKSPTITTATLTLTHQIDILQAQERGMGGDTNLPGCAGPSSTCKPLFFQPPGAPVVAVAAARAPPGFGARVRERGGGMRTDGPGPSTSDVWEGRGTVVFSRAQSTLACRRGVPRRPKWQK